MPIYPYSLNNAYEIYDNVIVIKSHTQMLIFISKIGSVLTQLKLNCLPQYKLICSIEMIFYYKSMICKEMFNT